MSIAETLDHWRWREAWARIAFLVRREYLAIWRDKRSRAVLIAPPLIQLLLFSYAATFEVNHVPLAVFNEDMSVESRELVARFTASPTFTDIARVTSMREAQDLVDRDKALMVLRIPATFGRDLKSGHGANIQLILDGRQSNTALIALSYANTIVADYSRERAAQMGVRNPPSVLVDRAWFNPNMTSQWFIVPGLVATLTMIVATVITSLSIAREKELGTFEQLLVTPLRPYELLIGKIIPAASLALMEGLLLGVLGMAMFGVPLRGDVALLILGLALFMLSVTSCGLMISSLTSTQQQAQIAAFCFIMPCVILSGFTTPVENMPDWVQVITYADPLRYILIISRGIFLQDMPPLVVLHNLWPMALIGVITGLGAIIMFRRRVL
ncbi:MAG: ABC transporter permease [Rhodospirillaceae bacterium]|nr:ABC transporter permease [Rhodospirillaceae bacterium]